jgi:hypothetical protein
MRPVAGTLLLLALAPLGPLRAAADRVVLCQFDFGGDIDTKIFAQLPGHQRVGRVYRSPRFLWISGVRDAQIEGETDAVLRNGSTGQSGEFRVGLDNGVYQVTLVMGDRNRPHGPFDIYLQDDRVKSAVSIAAGEVSRLTLPLKVADGRMRLRFEAAPKQTFLINGLTIEGPRGARLRSMFPDAPPDFLPTRKEVLAQGSADVRGALRAYCEWLLATRRPNGFIGDWGDYGGSREPRYYWYTSAYPIRTLLAGYQILGERRYLEASEQILDRLVEEQLPNGAFQQVFRGKPTSALTPDELQTILTRSWMNTADVGSIVTALAVAAHYAEEPRKTQYRNAARRYCIEYAAQWQKPSGGFTNGIESGKPQTNIYSVATGTEAAAFAATYAVTGDEQLLAAAQRAATFLIDNFTADGRPMSYPHSPGKPVEPYLQPVLQVGELFYQHDGILFVYSQSKDRRFLDKVREAYGRHVRGGQGVLQSLSNGVWWPLQDSWNNSKSAAMPLVLLAHREMSGEASLDGLLGVMRRFLCTPRYSRRIGIMVDDPDLPWGGHTLQSWTGCAVAATGFGGLSLAQMAAPGIVWLR